MIKRNSDLQVDKDNATAQIAALLDADEATASAILADNPHIQSLIDEASAALPSTPRAVEASIAAS
ncbi:MAG: hypothetical protein V7L20_26205 [Nostoc sp.]|uniref:hypothetical protein n=1 Tax=Nostoc sp. TaxID=1180 RepID=UPI002FF5D3F7